MPHVVYLSAFLLCPWLACGQRIELIDFQLEHAGDASFYSRVVAKWGTDPTYGLVGRCPGSGRFVWFGTTAKRAVPEPLPVDLDVLPDDWHQTAYLA
jgi:hypothetical protein